MKIIDKTPFLDEQGEIGIGGRIRGSFKYGFSWYAEMEAQKVLVTQLNRVLEKGFVLIRNFNLPGSPIFIPLILIGTGGIYVIHTTPAKGSFEVKGDQWNVVESGGNSQPAKENLIQKALKLTRAFQKFLEINKIKITAPVETIFVAVDPGAHIESTRPAIKVIKSDTIKNFIASLLQVPPVWRPDYIYELADRIVEPRMREETPEPEPAPASAPVSDSFNRFGDAQPPSQPFDAGDFRSGFAETAVEQQPAPQETAAPSRQPRPRSAPAKKIMGMSRGQFFVIAGIIVFWLCLMAGMGALLFLYPPQ